MPSRQAVPEKRAGPKMDVLLVRPPGAPKLPTRAALKRLFARAWTMVSEAARSAAAGPPLSGMAKIMQHSRSAGRGSGAGLRARPCSAGRDARPTRLCLAVDVIVMDDAGIARLNRKFHRRAGPTDVLSFPLGDFDPERKAHHLGEIVLSHETARREAKARGLPFENELSRYAVHGFLHLLGYEDDTLKKRREMERIQEAVLRKGG